MNEIDFKCGVKEGGPVNTVSFAGKKISSMKDTVLIKSLCPNEYANFESWFTELIIDTPSAFNISLIKWFDYFVDGETPSHAIDCELFR